MQRLCKLCKLEAGTPHPHPPYHWNKERSPIRHMLLPAKSYSRLRFITAPRQPHSLSWIR